MKRNFRKIFAPLTLLNRVIKKNKKLIFFYSNMGFRDNVRALYEYLLTNNYNKTYRIVVSTNDHKRYAKKAPYNVKFVGNARGAFSFFRAKYAFYCFGKYPIKPSYTQTVVNLWHGTPLKKLGNLQKGLENIDYHYFTKVITSAFMYKKIMAQIFGCSKEDVEVIGNPRNDEMFKVDTIKDTSVRRGCKKLVVWLPTYREAEEEFPVPGIDQKGLLGLDEFLKEKGCRMIIKPHPLQKVNILDQKYSYIDILTQEQLERADMTVYTLLRNSDGLVTDYSSVYFDYLLLDRPIAFAVMDMSEYEKSRGFLFDNPEEYMPGMRVDNISGIEQFVLDIINEKDDYKEARHKVNKKVNYYTDGNAAKRIAERFIPTP